MHLRSCRNHGVLVERIGLPVHQARPRPEGCRIHRQYVIGAGQQFQPRFDFAGFLCVLLSRQFNAGLYLAQGHCGQKQLRIVD